MKLTTAELEVLRYLASSTDGKRFFYDGDLVATVHKLCWLSPPLISDVYDTGGGSFVARITPAGRSALQEARDDQ